MSVSEPSLAISEIPSFREGVRGRELSEEPGKTKIAGAGPRAGVKSQPEGDSTSRNRPELWAQPARISLRLTALSLSHTLLAHRHEQRSLPHPVGFACATMFGSIKVVHTLTTLGVRRALSIRNPPSTFGISARTGMPARWPFVQGTSSQTRELRQHL